MGGGPNHVKDYSLGHSAVRTADGHRFQLEDKDLYWREDVESEIIKHIAERHGAEHHYNTGDEGGSRALAHLQNLDFDLTFFALGNHDSVEPEDVEEEDVIAGEVMEWAVEEGGREYRVAMAHSPDDFGMKLGTEEYTGRELLSEDGDFYDLVITGDSHLPYHHRLNPKTVADKAGSISETYPQREHSVEHFFPDRRLLEEFPDQLRDEIPVPDRSFAVIRFWNGITIYRYDAEELSEAYHYEDREMEDVEPESVFSFPYNDLMVEMREGEMISGEKEALAMKD